MFFFLPSCFFSSPFLLVRSVFLVILDLKSSIYIFFFFFIFLHNKVILLYKSLIYFVLLLFSLSSYYDVLFCVSLLMSAENTHITLASVLHFHVVLALFIKFWVLDLLLCVYFEMQA